METSFQFVTRLMEEEGIFYFFQHDNGSHTLVLADDSSVWQPPTAHEKIHMLTGETPLEDEGSITACTIEQQVTAGQFKTDDYNFELPSTDLLATATTKETDRSLYEYPGGLTTKDPLEARAGRILAALEVPGKLLCGTSPCRSFRAGAKFTLEGHSRSDVNGAWVLQSVSFRGDPVRGYSNTFEAFPAATVYRPPRLAPKPRIPGAQTATVTGKSGEEIWTDKYGRITVKFHWDQAKPVDETSSCWVRVAQGWAGKQWGAFFLPRVGQEVIVSFLEGDPDRPIVTGSVYNATQTVPYALPDNQTRSTIKTNSSKGGGGFNEIRFEDKKGSEELFIQAQKDMTINVLNDCTSTIKNNRTTTIQEKDEALIVDKGNRSVKVNKGDETHEVKGKRDLTVTGAESHTNKADYKWDITGNLTLTVKGNLSIEAQGTVSVKGASITNEAKQAMTNKAMTLTNQGSVSQTVDGGPSLTLKGGMIQQN
jgi:type VI secretion system secreted protein VgrG